MLLLTSHFKYVRSIKVKTDGTDRRTDGRTPDHYVTLTARHGQRNQNAFAKE